MENIMNYLNKYFKAFYKPELSPETNLFENGALDSMGIVTLISNISDDFQLNIEPEDINEENFQSIKNIATLIAKKQQ